MGLAAKFSARQTGAPRHRPPPVTLSHPPHQAPAVTLTRVVQGNRARVTTLARHDREHPQVLGLESA